MKLSSIPSKPQPTRPYFVTIYQAHNSLYKLTRKNSAIGAVLQQLSAQHWYPLPYFSKALSPTQIKYSTFDRELLAINLSIKHFRYMLEGRVFTVFTDHKPLVWGTVVTLNQFYENQIMNRTGTGQYQSSNIYNIYLVIIYRAELSYV